MKALLIACLCLVAVNALLENRGTWVADTQNKFAGMTLEQKQKYLGTIMTPLGDNAPKTAYPKDGETPQDFDARTQWPNCIHPIRDQEQCGSCWAFGASESFSDKICIATNGAINVVLSAEDLVSCDTENYGCSGGYLAAAWDYISNVGLVADTCFPYSAGSGNAPACQTTCSDGSAWTVYTSTNVQALSIPDGQTAMMTTGPIETAFNVYDDFFSYSSGVYVWDGTSALDGGHAVKVIGWGFDQPSGLNYWLVANSWGPSWGINGFFKIAFGQCTFDSNFITGDYAGTSSGNQWFA
jgi:cathepsin B